MEGGEPGRALGQLARAATAGLGKGVPTSLRSSSPALPLLATGEPHEPWGPLSRVLPIDISPWVASYPDHSKHTSLAPLTQEPPDICPAIMCGPRQFPLKDFLEQTPRLWESTFPSIPCSRNDSPSKTALQTLAQSSSLQSNSVVFPLNPSYPPFTPSPSPQYFFFFLHLPEDLVLPSQVVVSKTLG